MNDHPTASRRGCLDINSLPNELLLEIFRLYVFLCRDMWQCGRERTPYLWVQLMGVCRLWYTLFMDSAQFWSQILSKTDFELAKMMLRRSQKLPLAFQSTDRRMLDCHFSDDLRREIFREIHRVHVLEIAIFPEELIEFKATIMHAPCMKHLTFDALFLEPAGYVPLHLPGRPGLYRQGVFLCPELRSLNLTYGGGSSSYFLDLLASLPQIEMFSLDMYSGFVVLHPEPQQRSPVTLSKLRTLSILAKEEDCIWLISHLEFPSSTRLECDARDTTGGPRIDAFLSMLSEKVQMKRYDSPDPPRLAPVESVRIFLGKSVDVRLWRRALPMDVMKEYTPGQGSNTNEHLPEEFRPDLGFLIDNKDSEQIARLIIQHFTLSAVKLLFIAGTPYPTGDTMLTAGGTFARMFRKCDSLRTLYVRESYVGDVTSFLLHCGEHGVEHCEHPGCPLIFPALKYLSLEHLDWSEPGSPELNEDRPLHEMLEQRQHRDVPLERLEVIRYLNSKHEPEDVEHSLKLIGGPEARELRVDQTKRFHRFGHPHWK